MPQPRVPRQATEPTIVELVCPHCRAICTVEKYIGPQYSDPDNLACPHCCEELLRWRSGADYSNARVLRLPPGAPA